MPAVVEEYFLMYLEEWEEEVSAKAKEGNSASERAKMSLSEETIDRLRMTGRYKYPLHSNKYISMYVYALCVYILYMQSCV